MSELVDLFYSSDWGAVLQIAGAIASVVALVVVVFAALLRFEILPLTWRDAVRATKSMKKKILKDNWSPDMIVCLGRSGGIWGGFLAGILGSKPAIMVMDSYSSDGSYVEFGFLQQCVNALNENNPKRVLVVHGYSGLGGTFFHFREKLSQRPSLNQIEFRFGSVFAWKGCRFNEKHYVGKKLRRRPARMPWHDSPEYVTAM